MTRALRLAEAILAGGLFGLGIIMSPWGYYALAAGVAAMLLHRSEGPLIPANRKPAPPALEDPGQRIETGTGGAT